MIESVEHEWRNDHDTKNHCPAAGAFAGFEPHRLRQSGADHGHHRKNRADRPADCRGPERYRRGHQVCRSARLRSAGTCRRSSEEPAQASDQETAAEEPAEAAAETPAIDEDGVYTSKDDVALYLHTYGHLPSNFITKKEAEKLGWSGGSLEPYAPGKCIGGSHFGNYEGILPEKDGRSYTECDIDTLGADKRGAKRIVFSNDGLIYYTEDHYETFELLYGEES